jgi:hypothetical protein
MALEAVLAPSYKHPPPHAIDGTKPHWEGGDFRRLHFQNPLCPSHTFARTNPRMGVGTSSESPNAHATMSPLTCGPHMHNHFNNYAKGEITARVTRPSIYRQLQPLCVGRRRCSKALKLMRRWTCTASVRHTFFSWGGVMKALGHESAFLRIR